MASMLGCHIGQFAPRRPCEVDDRSERHHARRIDRRMPLVIVVLDVMGRGGGQPVAGEGFPTAELNTSSMMFPKYRSYVGQAVSIS